MLIKINFIAAIIFIASVGTASAGGICGDGGLIRGALGKACDKYVEKPITTPMARQAAVMGGQALGTYFGGPVGGVVGGMVGHGVNDAFAGGRRQHQQPVEPLLNYMPPVHTVDLGNFCGTQFGMVGPGVPLPIGSACWVDTNQGRIFGRITR